MVSIVSDSKIDSKSAFFTMEFSPEEGTTMARGTTGSVSPPRDEYNEARASEIDMEARVSGNFEKDFSGSVASPSGDAEVLSDGARISEADSEREGSVSGSSLEVASRWMNGLKVGDMVWGKVKSHPWWPGHIFNEAFASPSVRRTKREGHVLVAFFGDSSYGWFDPAELIAFDPHFPEKSRQTTSRPFVKAVEEAVDEVSRRGALGLSCYCRNPRNFRPTTVTGYFSVDVVGFEPGGIYSSTQIEYARDNLVADNMLFFLQQLGVSPQKDDSSRTVDWIRSMSALLAYRRAVFEEFDETYAQAFGVQPVRPSKNLSDVPDPPLRAPLSGPLVIAEALGNKKKTSSSSKPSTRSAKNLLLLPSSSSSSKKNKYVLKRRDETPALPYLRPDITTTPLHAAPPATTTADFNFDLSPGQHPQATLVISSLQAFREAGAASTTATFPSSTSSSKPSQIDNYVLQKRSPPEKPQRDSAIQDDSKLAGYEFTTGAESAIEAAAPDAHWRESIERSPTTPLPADDWISVQCEKAVVGFDEGTMPVKLEQTISITDTTNVFRQDDKPPGFDLKEAEAAAAVAMNMPATDSRQPNLEAVAGVAPMDFGPVQEPKAVLDGIVKKERVRKRRAEDDDTGEMKKKTKKKTKKKIKLEDLSEIPKDVEPRSKAAAAEIDQSELQAKHAEVRRSVLLSKLDLFSPELELPQILFDLSALALDPFHGIELNAPDIVRHIFLRFRTKVYQKSLVLPSDVEDDSPAPAVRVTKPLQEPKAGMAADTTTGKDVKEQKPVKTFSFSKLDDPTKVGRKRAPSDRQEEISAKRLKKFNRLKALASEKKTGMITQKPPEAQPAQVTEPVKKREPPPPPRIRSPTFLLMKFQPRASLPSVATLKARFARFGALDVDATRVYWKSYTCKLLFMYKSDAEAACNYGKNHELFGQVKVHYFVKAADAPELPPVEPKKRRREEGPHFRPGNGNGGLKHPPHQPRQSLGQLKSILKKPADEAGAPAAAIVKGVKFMLGSDDGRREPSAVVCTDHNEGGGVEVAQISPSEPISRNPKSVNFGPPPPPSFHPLRFPPFSAAPAQGVPILQHSHMPGTQWFPPPRPPLPLPPRTMGGFDSRGLVGPFRKSQPHSFGEVEARESKADISHQMFDLLLRCNSIVTNVRSMSGYVPYRPL